MSVRWTAMVDALHRDIAEGRLRPGDRLPSETALAAQWNVCRMTAHRVLTELGRLGVVERKRRVGTIVRHPDSVVEDTPVRKTRQVALLFYGVSGYPQASYLEGFRAALPDTVHLLYCDTQNNAAREAAFLREMARQADAICCYPTGHPDNTPLFEDIILSNKPVVCLDHFPEGGMVESVITDNYGSTRAALTAMAEQGHRRIAFISTNRSHITSVRERRNALRDFLNEQNCGEPTDALFPTLPRVTGHTFEAYAELIRKALVELLALPAPPTALLCLEDFFLATTLEACDRLRWEIPQDMEILSFSDIPHIEPRIPRTVHRIVQRAEEMGKIAAQRLNRRLEGETLTPEIIRVPAQWIPASRLSSSKVSREWAENPAHRSL